jgi:putative DNA primase/helicase
MVDFMNAVQDVLAAALHLASLGFSVLPCNAEKKPTCPHGFNDATRDPDGVRALWHCYPGELIGIATGSISGFVVLDIDETKHTEAAAWKNKYGPRLPETFCVKSRSGGTHYFFQYRAGLKCSASKIARGVDVRGDGGYVIYWPATGCQIVSIAPFALWPEFLDKQLAAGGATSASERVSVPVPASLKAINNDALAAIVRALPNDERFNDRTDWLALAHALAAAFPDNLGLAEELWLEHAGKREQTPGEPERVWATLSGPHRVGAGWIVDTAKAAGVDSSRYEYAAARAAFNNPHASAVGTPEVEDARPPDFTDEALALRFAASHQDRLRYVANWGKWLIWNGTVWQFDDTMQSFNLARAICRCASAECLKPNIAATIASAKTVAAVERLARADRRLAATVDTWDHDPWLLNTPGGVVDLRTGNMRRHEIRDYMTKITNATPGGECPLWHRFLKRITGRDVELQRFLQRGSGYALSGSTQEHALFFGHGPGANGKGVFLNTTAASMGSYAATAPMETFTASQSERHPTDLAMLRGARLVTAQETEEGRRWAESKIKALTGGDPISARFMRQDFFTFTPRFKLFITGNYKPGLRNVDEAIRRRLHLIPFSVVIPASERDRNLAETLKAEWSGILAWAIEGCLAWQREGLAPPAAVRTATVEYLADEDGLALWINECCIVSPGGKAGSSELFLSWQFWAGATKEWVGSQKRFSQALMARGYSKIQEDGRMFFLGIALRPPKLSAPAAPPAPGGVSGEHAGPLR